MSANLIRLRKWEGIDRNAEFGMENLVASRLVSWSKLPWKLPKGFVTSLSGTGNPKYATFQA